MHEYEKALVAEIESRRGALLEDLRLHVGIPTGGFNEEGIERTRGILVGRLEALGARTTHIDGDPKPEWLLGGGAGAYIPRTSVCERLNGAESGRVLIAGHMDTVHFW